MKIAYDAAPLLNPRTGVGQYTAALLEHLVASPGVEMSLFAIGRQRTGAALPVPIRRLGIPARLVVVGWEVARRPSAERLVGTVDVVHGTNFWVPPLRRSNGAVTVHDLTFRLFPEFCTPQVRRYRWILPRVLRRCGVVFTPSQTVAEQLSAEFAFPLDRIVVTPEGVRGTATAPGAPPLQRRAPGDYVLFVGTREPRKNLDRLVQAFALLRDLDISLVVAGPPGWGPDDPGARAAQLGISNSVVLTGYVSDAELAGLMQGARVFAFPSLYEGFGLPPLEAMAAGIPVVAARAGSLPEVLGDAPLWCDPTDTGSIAEALRSAITDEAARACAMRAGLARAARYRWSETARLTLDGYHQV